MVQVVHSANVRVGGSGHGATIFEVAGGLHRAHQLKRLIVSSIKRAPVPRELITAQGFGGRVQKRLAFYDQTGWGDYVVNRLYDVWVSRVMPQADIFEGWTGFCETSLRVAKTRSSHTFLHLGSAHPRTQLDLVNSERRTWGLPPLPKTPLAHQVERELDLAERIIVQSQFSAQTLIAHGLAKEKIVCLPLGVDVRHFSPAQSFDHPFRVLFVGQVTLRKGVQYLLEAWTRLNWRDAELWLVGQTMPDFAPVAKRYGQLPGLRMMGYVPEPAAAFQACDVFVLPSVEDGFALVVPEAMACGLPVIVSNHVGAADLIQNGESGFVATYNQPDEYARVLEQLRSNPQRTRTVGQNAHVVAQNQTWDNYCAQLANSHMETNDA